MKVSVSAALEESPVRLGPYRVVRRLGHGGMGVVYEGLDEASGARVALKTVRVPHARMLGSIRRELHTLGRLAHPGVVRVLGSGLWGGMPWYAMAYLEGPTLETFCRPSTETATHGVESLTWVTESLDTGGSFTALEGTPGVGAVRSGVVGARPEIAGGHLERALALTRRLCQTLAWLHGEGIVHGDLKPSNVIVTPGLRPVLVDFGLVARFTGEVSREELDARSAAMGTVDYMAPEVCLGELIDARADLYALGCVLYALLTGWPPFARGTAQERIEAHITAPPPPLSSWVSGATPALEALVQGLLAKAPAERIGHAGVVAAALEELGAQPWDEGPPPRAYLYRPSLAGREVALAEGRRELRRLASGEGGVVLVGGESGIGKTRLLMELGSLARRQGIRVLVGGAEPGPAPALGALRAPLQGIADWCRERGPAETARVLGERGGVLAQYAPAIRELPGQGLAPPPSPLPPAASQLRLFRALSATFYELARSGPVLLLLDDLQWGDELTLEALVWLAAPQRWRGQALLIVGSYRSEEVTEGLERLRGVPSARQLSLERLGLEAVAAMSAEMLAITPPGALVGFLAAQSEGNPFFVAEYLRIAVAEGLLRRDAAGRWELVVDGEALGGGAGALERLPLPSSLREVVERRLAALTVGGRAVLGAGAVLGREPDPALLAELVGEAVVHEEVHGLILRETLEELPSGRLRFSHDKIREFVYAGLAEEERRALHARAAAGLATRPEAARSLAGEIALHHERAGDAACACPRYWQAARFAREQNALHETEQHLRAWLRLASSDDPLRPHVRNYLGHQVLDARGELEAALAEHTRAKEDAARLGDSRGVAHSLKGMLREEISLGRDDRIDGLYEEALRLGQEAEDHKLVMELRFLRGQHSHQRGQYARAEAELMLARAAAEARGDALGASNVLSVLISVYRGQGRYDEALASGEEALALLSGFSDLRLEASIMSRLGLLAAEQGRAREAVAWHERALALFRECQERRWEGVTLTNLGDTWFEAGELDAALGYTQEAIVVCGEVGARGIEAVARLTLARIHAQRRELEPGRAAYKAATALMETSGFLSFLIYARAHAATLERRAGDYDAARRLLDANEPLRAAVDDGHSWAVHDVEVAFLALAQGADAGPPCARVQAWGGDNHEVKRLLAALLSARERAASGAPLVHGEHPEALPEAWREGGRGEGPSQGSAALVEEAEMTGGESDE